MASPRWNVPNEPKPCRSALRLPASLDPALPPAGSATTTNATNNQSQGRNVRTLWIDPPGSGSLTACLFAGSFLAAMVLDRFWKKALLVGLAVLFAFVMNLARSLFLAGWAYAYGSDAIEGALHDGTGYAVLGLTSAGLFALLPLFSGARWRRWFGVEEGLAEDGGR